MKKTAAILCALAFWVLGTPSCSDLEDLKDDLSDLDGRIEALEARMKSLNESVEAIGALTRATTVNSVTFEDNVYTVVLSDGTELTLTVGEAGVGNIPLITVDDDGFWMVDYRDGKGAVYLTDNGRKFCSTGKDAVTPVFSVDPEGYWMMDYGDGPVHVLDSKGGKVLATSSEETLDPLFEEVVYDKAAGTLTVTLRADGRKISLPVVPDFLLALSNADGLQLFDYGQTKVFPVRSKGVGDAVVQTPLGWSAVLEEGSFSVTAPIRTRSTPIADSDTDVVIVAQSASGRYISVSKVRVSLSDAEIDLDPRAAVTPDGVPTATTLGFLVTLEEATSYKYILRKNREAVPAYDEVKESGIESSESRLLLEGLDPRTGYTLYLIACNGDIHAAELVTASATTANPDYASYYAAYESGAELEIGGLVVSKAVFGEATLLTEETKTITADGVYFVPDGVTATYASGTRNTLIVIGDNPSGRGEFTITTTRITFNPTNRGHFVLFNLHFRLSTANGEGQILFYPNSTAGGMMQTVAMEDCDLDLTGFQGFSFTASRTADTPIGIENISFVGCDINVGPSTRFGYFFQYREHGSIGSAVFRNNVIWSGNAANATRIFNLSMGQSEAQYAAAAPVGSLEFERNTWINCKPSVINIVKNVGRLVIRNNLFYGAITQHTPFITYEAGCVPSSGEIIDNLGYNTNGTGTPYWKAVNNSFLFPGSREFTMTKENPFDGGRFDTATGVFVPGTAYASYGARR